MMEESFEDFLIRKRFAESCSFVSNPETINNEKSDYNECYSSKNKSIKIRHDRNGNLIAKGKKTHHITFADMIKSSKVKLVTRYEVESYKEYNHTKEKSEKKCCCVIM